MNRVVAVMQPYFFPYLGYLRLFANSDLFIVYDNVQFPKEGWVHRNKLRKHNGDLDWLTLPIAKCPLKTRIADIEFNHQLQENFVNSLNRFSSFSRNDTETKNWKKRVTNLTDAPLSYLVGNLEALCNHLSLPFNIVFASELDLDFGLDAQLRVIQACKKVGATEYVNLSGGRQLYQDVVFASEGLQLTFLPDYEGEYVSSLQRILENSKKEVLDELNRV